MAYNSLVNPDQPQYRVEGHVPNQTVAEPAPVSSSDVSLQLKPEKNESARQPQTPSRTDGSEQESLRLFLREAEARALENERQIAERNKAQSKPRDALDAVIDEFRTVKDLVSLAVGEANRRSNLSRSP